VALVERHLRVCEAKGGQACGGVRLVAAPVAGLLCRGAVVTEPIRLDY
jgi:hypothetical protein